MWFKVNINGGNKKLNENNNYHVSTIINHWFSFILIIDIIKVVVVYAVIVDGYSVKKKNVRLCNILNRWFVLVLMARLIQTKILKTLYAHQNIGLAVDHGRWAGSYKTLVLLIHLQTMKMMICITHQHLRLLWWVKIFFSVTLYLFALKIVLSFFVSYTSFLSSHIPYTNFFFTRLQRLPFFLAFLFAFMTICNHFMFFLFSSCLSLFPIFNSLGSFF